MSRSIPLRNTFQQVHSNFQFSLFLQLQSFFSNFCLVIVLLLSLHRRVRYRTDVKFVRKIITVWCHVRFQIPSTNISRQQLDTTTILNCMLEKTVSEVVNDITGLQENSESHSPLLVFYLWKTVSRIRELMVWNSPPSFITSKMIFAGILCFSKFRVNFNVPDIN